MSEEKPRQDPPGPEGKARKSTRSVTVYLAILFLAALLLLVLSFFMQQRNHQALLDLNENMTASQDITELQMANQQLEFQLEDLKRQNSDLKKETEALTREQEDAAKQAEALEWLRQIEAATRTSFTKCKELVEAFEATGLEKYLPDVSVVEGGTSPSDTYRNIYAMVF